MTNETEMNTTNTTPHWSDELVGLRACEMAIAFAKQFDTFADAWDACPDGRWLLWYLRRTAHVNDKTNKVKFVKIACAVARETLTIFESEFPNDYRPRKGIEKAEATVEDGNISKVILSADAVAAVAAAARYYAARCAAMAAYYSVAAANAADGGEAAYCSLSAAHAAAEAAAATVDAGARKRLLLKIADIVRSQFPMPNSR